MSAARPRPRGGLSEHASFMLCKVWLDGGFGFAREKRPRRAACLHTRNPRLERVHVDLAEGIGVNDLTRLGVHDTRRWVSSARHSSLQGRAFLAKRHGDEGQPVHGLFEARVVSVPGNDDDLQHALALVELRIQALQVLLEGLAPGSPISSVHHDHDLAPRDIVQADRRAVSLDEGVS
eukprot:Tamp_29589.p1 GENE.Tamp_29589~~Tamp_29589.p1  ORF type:complete len:178 (-),score=1.49 Tamp_29589:37-570(-)